MISQYKNLSKIIKEKDHRVYNIYKDFDMIRTDIVSKYPTADFMNGQCMLFHIELSKRFEDCQCLISNDHVVSHIQGSLWDYTGCLYWEKFLEPRVLENYLERVEEFLDGYSTSSTN